MNAVLIKMGALLAFCSVLFGAFGAHLLKHSLSQHEFEIFQTATEYQMFHALGILILGTLPHSRQLVLAARTMIAGLLVFSGSLYLLVFTGAKWLGAITPIGGTLLLISWALVAWSATTHKSKDKSII